MQEETGSVADAAPSGGKKAGRNTSGGRKGRRIPTVDAVLAKESAAPDAAAPQDERPAAAAVAEEGVDAAAAAPDGEDEMKKYQDDNNLKLFDEDAEAEEQARLDARRADMNLEGETALLETVLFLESEPQSAEVLAKITQLSEDVVSECLERLKEKYLSPDSGIELSQIIGGWMLVPKKECFELVKERYGKKNEGRLSKAAIETLSIIAYSQPITRAEIENYRHVNADNMMRILLDRKFIKEVGKKDVPGKPVLYGTTKEFLEFFHLQSIADLPQLDEKENERFVLAR